jgi:transposase
MVVMFDNRLRQGIDRDSKTQYLLELLADDLIEASLYADEGPPEGTSRPVNPDDGVSAPLGWVEIRPAEQARQRLVAWTTDGVPTERLTHIEVSAYERVIEAEPPAAYLVVHPVSGRMIRGHHRRCPVPKLLRLRRLSAEEEQEIARLARSRTAPVRLVERARIIELARQGRRAPAIAAEVGVAAVVARRWIRRFNAQGLEGLADAPRPGRPATYTPEQVGELVAASLTDPQALGLPFASWTLDRLAAYLQEEKAIAIKRSRIGEILQAEGLRWRQQETWFGERPDPAFAAKRGLSSRSTPPRLRTAS